MSKIDLQTWKTAPNVHVCLQEIAKIVCFTLASVITRIYRALLISKALIG